MSLAEEQVGESWTEDRLVQMAFNTPDLTPFIDLDPDCFQKPINKRIHEAFRNMMLMEGADLSPLSVYEWINKRYPDSAGVDLFFDLAEKGERGGPWFGDLCKRLSNSYMKQIVIDAIGEGRELAEAASTATEARDNALGRIASLGDVDARTDMHLSTNSLRDIIKTSEENFKKPDHLKGLPVGVPTGFHLLDRALGGLKPGGFYVLGALSGRGKSVFACNLARNAARFGAKVLYVSIEMPHTDLIRRILSAEASLSTDIIEGGWYDDEGLDRLLCAVKEMKTYSDRLHVFDRGTANVFEIASKVRQLKMTKGLDLVIVDYIQIIRTKKGHSRENEVALISQGLHAIARTNDIPVFALTQLNGDGHVRESKRIEQDAWGLMKIDYAPDQWVKGTEDVYCTLKVEKSRYGIQTDIPLKFQRAYSRFLEQ